MNRALLFKDYGINILIIACLVCLFTVLPLGAIWAAGQGSYNDAYWASQPPEVQALRNIDEPDARRAEAAKLANAGFTIDVPIMSWGWDAEKTMQLREDYGYTRVPSALEPNVEVAPGLTVPGLQPYNPSLYSIPVTTTVDELNKAKNDPNYGKANPANAGTIPTTGITFTSADDYWSQQPPAVQALRNIEDPEERRAAAFRLAQQGYTIDNAIMVWGWDPVKTTQLRQEYGYTWVPSALQPNIAIAPGLSMPGVQPYDPNNPPPGSIKVGSVPNTGENAPRTEAILDMPHSALDNLATQSANQEESLSADRTDFANNPYVLEILASIKELERMRDRAFNISQ